MGAFLRGTLWLLAKRSTLARPSLALTERQRLQVTKASGARLELFLALAGRSGHQRIVDYIMT